MEGAWKLGEIGWGVVFGLFYYFLSYSGSKVGERCVMDRPNLILALVHHFWLCLSPSFTIGSKKVLSYSYGIEFWTLLVGVPMSSVIVQLSIHFHINFPKAFFKKSYSRHAFLPWSFRNMEGRFKHVLPYFPRRTCLSNHLILSLYEMQILHVPICHLLSQIIPSQFHILYLCQNRPIKNYNKISTKFLPQLTPSLSFLQLLSQAPILLINLLPPDMSLRVPKNQTSSFKAPRSSELRNSSQKFGYSPDKSESRIDRTSEYGVRFKRKDLREFQAELYITGRLNYQDVLDLKEVFDAYDSTGMGVLLPNDLKLLLTQNGFNPNRKTTYEVVAEFDVEEAGGISFIEFMKAMDTKPYRNETKKEIAAIFKKYDRDNKNYLTIDDFREVNNHVKENLDEETLRLMVEKADSNRDGKVSFEDFYSVMIKDIY